MLKLKINSFLNLGNSVDNYLDIDFDINKNYRDLLLEKSRLFNAQKKIKLYITEKSSIQYGSRMVDGQVQYFIDEHLSTIDFKNLSQFKDIKEIIISTDSIINYDDLNNIDSRSLSVFGLIPKRIPPQNHDIFKYLENFKLLDKLFLNFPRGKLRANIGKFFSKLRYLSLEGLNSKSTINFSELTNLEYLYLFCETVQQYDLHTLISLRALELYNCLKDENVDYISEMENLEAISIGSFRSLKRLPDFSKLKKLKSISLYNCNQLEDFTPLLQCPSLEFIGLDGFPKDFDLTKVYCLADLPNLKKFGSFGNRGFVLKPHLPEAVKLNEVFHGKYSPDFEHFYFYYLAEKPEDSYMQDFGNGNAPVG